MRAAALVIGAVLLLPRLAEACPMCASQQPGGTARIVALGSMILLPFAITFIVFRALRRAGASASAGPVSGRAAATAPSATSAREGGEGPGRLRELSS